MDDEIKDEKQQKLSEDKELDWDDVEEVDVIGLEIGYGLIPLVNPETGGQLMPRVKGVRKKLTSELGYLIHPIRIEMLKYRARYLQYHFKWCCERER